MKRVLLKLSGEALAGEKHTGFDEPTVTKVAKQVKTLVDQGIEVGIVIGGGNFWRGRSSENIDRTNIDVLAVRNDGAGALRQVRQTGRQPLADQLVCSNRLDRTAVERNDDKALV